MPQQLQRELERLIAGYPLMSRVEQQVILGLVEERLRAASQSTTKLRLVVSDRRVLAGAVREPRGGENSLASFGG
jgi:hypothetical protein